MVFVFNELSTLKIAQDVDTAHKWLEVFFEICDHSYNRLKETISIISTKKFSQIYFHQGTSFANWIGTLQDVDFKRRILAMITKDQIRVDYPYYYYEGQPCQGLGYAFENNHISLSYGAEYWNYDILVLTREQFNKDEQVETASLSVKHISSLWHLDKYFPVRKFKSNPKHDRAHPLANKGEEVSILECSDERAISLLSVAIGENSPSDKQLYFFDKEVEKYIIFYRHDAQINEYHGYHTKNENEIPYSVRKELKETGNI